MATRTLNCTFIQGVLLAVTTFACSACSRQAPPRDTTQLQAEPLPAAETAPIPVATTRSAGELPPSGPSREQLTWTVKADAAEGVLTQEPGATSGTCTLTYFSNRIRAEVWRSTNCIAQKGDAIFMAPDGRSVLVLHPELSVTAWQVGVVAELSRSGESIVRVRANEVVSLDSEVKIVGQSVHWLQGLSGEPGPGPRLTPRGDAVIFTRMDGTDMLMDFEGRVTRAEAPERVAQTPRPAIQSGVPSPSFEAEQPSHFTAPTNTYQRNAPAAPIRGGPGYLGPRYQGLNSADALAAQAADCQANSLNCIDTARNGKLDESQFKLGDDRSHGVISNDDNDEARNRVKVNYVR